MLIWTLVFVFAWLYKLVHDPTQFPELPNQALLLMGISGATYLGAKHIGASGKAEASKGSTAPEKKTVQGKEGSNAE